MRDGREPLAHALLLLLHPAECSAEGPLRDLKGNTSKARWVRVGWVEQLVEEVDVQVPEQLEEVVGLVPLVTGVDTHTHTEDPRASSG